MRSIYIIATVAALGMWGCKHDSAVVITPVITPTIAAPTAGERVITYLNMNDTDMTAHLSGYYFDFLQNNVLSVYNGIDTLIGSWRQDAGDSGILFTINVPNADPMLAELNDEFIQEENTDSVIHLLHDHLEESGEHHHIDVYFTKQ